LPQKRIDRRPLPTRRALRSECDAVTGAAGYSGSSPFNIGEPCLCVLAETGTRRHPTISSPIRPLEKPVARLARRAFAHASTSNGHPWLRDLRHSVNLIIQRDASMPKGARRSHPTCDAVQDAACSVGTPANVDPAKLSAAPRKLR
jgi:hypothetical protein